MWENEMDILTFIWHVFFYHINRALDIPMKLERWAIDIARPYLLNNLPSALTPDISDPCNARMDYEEPEFMDFDAETEAETHEKQLELDNLMRNSFSGWSFPVEGDVREWCCWG
jgi:hypothetical protein